MSTVIRDDAWSGTVVYYPERVRFPSPNNLDTIELYLRSIVTNIYNGGSPDYNIRDNPSVIPVIFKGFETVLEISYKEEPYEQFNLKIGNELQEDQPCLNIRIYYDNGVVGKLVFVRSKNVVCSIPETHAGTWMVELNNSMLCSLGISTIYLEDDAVINCGGTPTKFSFVRIFRGDTPSWYQKFGYEVNLNTERVQRMYPGYNKAQYDIDIEQLRNYPYSKIVDGMQNLQQVYKILPKPHNDVIFEDGVEAINALNRHPSHETTLASYMSRLWTDDCNDYDIVSRFLRNSSRKIIDPTGKYFNWAPLYRRIEFTSYDYVLSAKC